MLRFQNQFEELNCIIIFSYKMQQSTERKKITGKEQNNEEKPRSERSSASSKSISEAAQKKKNSNERSRSRNKRRSRSKHSKKKHKHKHKSSKYRSRSKSPSRRRRSRSRGHKKDYRDRQRNRKYDRDQKYKPKDHNGKKTMEVEMPPIPTQIPMPPLPGEQRRKRQRSRSPLDYYRKNQNNNEGEFWDSFSWVPRINYTPNVSSTALANTKKMRRLMITNIPYEMGLTEENLRDLITKFMTQNYLKDQMNNCPVVNLQINQTDHNVAVELSSVEETCRMCRMEKIQLFKGYHNGIIRLGDSIYGNVLTQAQTAGTAQAAAFAAINVIENKKTNFTVDAVSVFKSASTLLRVVNAVTPYMASHLTAEQWQEYYEDLMEGFSQYGKIIHSWFVKEGEADVCAEPGNLFVEYEYKENAEAAMADMQERIYDERTIKLYYLPRQLYYQNFKPTLTPPTLPPPLKVKPTK